ncbi:MAG TPA: aminoglycoside phosphotransferase family protein [Micromonosporaceae bacterium]|nr:aminoglycoside phosphotransferase family protein [Micromonosporaceae bacterium]
MPGRVVPLGAGEWSRAYAVTFGGEELVFRLGAHGEDFAKDARMATYASDDLPIPVVLQLGQTADGTAFAVSRRAHGDFLDALDEDGMRAVLPNLLTTLDRLRRIEPPGTGYGLWRPDGSASQRTWTEALLYGIEDRPGQRVHGWRSALDASPTGARPFDTAARAFRKLAAGCPPVRQFVHSDLLNRNVLVQSGRITAVLDWGNSMYGDSLYDLAWLLYWWPWYPAWQRIDIRAAVAERVAGEANAEARLRCYQVHIGLDAQAYSAYMGRWDELARNARQTLELVS